MQHIKKMDILKVQNQYKEKRIKMVNFIKKNYIIFHLKYVCKRCKFKKKHKRDILNTGNCFWYEQWMKGNFDIPIWMGFNNSFRCILKKPIKINKIPFTFKQRFFPSVFALSLFCFFIWLLILN
jgi:hypothetical protein